MAERVCTKQLLRLDRSGVTRAQVAHSIRVGGTRNKSVPSYRPIRSVGSVAGRIDEAFGDAFTIAPIGDLLCDIRKVVLVIGQLDVCQ